MSVEMSAPAPEPEGAQAGRQPAMSRAGCVLGCAVWLFMMTVPLLALVLAMRGELVWRRGQFVEDRLWLVNVRSAPAQGEGRGLGYSAARVVSNKTAAGGPVCVRTRVHFWLWQGDSETLQFCDCYLAQPDGSYSPQGPCP